MECGFTSDFADYLEERLSKALFNLRKNNKEYRELSDEYETLLNSRYQSIDECNQVISKIADVSKRIDDIEKRYLLLAGMREHKMSEDALSLDSFEKLFTE